VQGNREGKPPVLGGLAVYDAAQTSTLNPDERTLSDVPVKRLLRAGDLQGGLSGVRHPRAVAVDPVRREVYLGDSKGNDIRVFRVDWQNEPCLSEAAECNSAQEPSEPSFIFLVGVQSVQNLPPASIERAKLWFIPAGAAFQGIRPQPLLGARLGQPSPRQQQACLQVARLRPHKGPGPHCESRPGRRDRHRAPDGWRIGLEIADIAVDRCPRARRD